MYGLKSNSRSSLLQVKGDEFNLLTVLYCMMMDTFIYAILVWYIEAVHPGSYGLPRPWYFVCQPSYWFGHNTQACPKMSRSTFQMMTADELEDAPQVQGLLAYEREPIHLTLGVTIENLVKVRGYSVHEVVFYFLASCVKAMSLVAILLFISGPFVVQANS